MITVILSVALFATAGLAQYYRARFIDAERWIDEIICDLMERLDPEA